ncbi:LIM and calponin homology domains-containing protein 1-like isoform X2 [Cyprinodon tularosa]|uniref:LIM and calponin homology domains-containing protein 1-like isoform X2 n=1 Tax=Cyprinodon tularosa TaxID=77115 RepID=UPI0018E241E6|nr:LIM and calponin homology domains-containing protein 1-like isoform X2 [Cyprinodon tularosa]
MASPAADFGQSHQHPPVTQSAADSAFLEAQKWIEAATGRCFGEKDFRGGLENGILLCELLSSIRPGLVKKINRLQTPIAGLDNLSVFLRGCEELGLKGSQLFDPGDLQDTSTRPAAKGSDGSRRLKNVLITIYWLGRAANSCTSYNGPTLDLKEFEGLLSQMRKEAETVESPQRSIRDSGYIDCWDSERSDSLSPPRHGREDSFDSLDSFGSRSQQTPSPDVLVPRGSSDDHGSDSESDGTPNRKMPDLHKDDMLARRTSVTELRTAMPFNQYLPNRSNQSGYVPAPLRKKKNDKEDGGRQTCSTATSPVGGDRPCSPKESPVLVLPLRESHSPSPTPHIEPQIQENKSEDDERDVKLSASSPCIVIHAVGIRRSSEPLRCGLYQANSEPPRETITQLKGTSEQSASTRSCSEDFSQYFATLSPNTTTSARKRQTTVDQQVAGVAGADGDDKWICQMLTSPKYAPSSSDFLPVPTAMATTLARATDAGRTKERSKREEPREEKSCSDRIPPRTSVSMNDMRGEEEAPHSHVRHERMHNQYNRMREDENHWQEDLARWKSRRRSVSQDLIKKEEERKMMERLMSGDGYISQRRKSIKTYREIVEEKERREEELREAYRKARTPEEASAVLQRYAQRFSISEAVLERLQLPKLLDRSVSADPSFHISPLSLSLSSSPTTPDPFDEDPSGPLRYLRQQSAPLPRFTSTLEAQIEEFPKDSTSLHRPQIRSCSSEPPSTRALSPKPVPLLSPKPYFQPQQLASEKQSSKVDGLLRVNGDIGNNSESKARESPPLFLPSPSLSGNGTLDAPSSDASPARCLPATPERRSQGSTKDTDRPYNTAAEDFKEENVTECLSSPIRPTTLPEELRQPEDSFGEAGGQTDAAQQEEKTYPAVHQQSTTAKPEKTELSSENLQQIFPTEVDTIKNKAIASMGSFQRMEMAPPSAAPGSLGYIPQKEVSSDDSKKNQHGNVSVPVLSQTRRGDRWSWDPDEERKRQERWQQEQERMLQEKYQREQEKLKEEWEKAQREVVEEERKYNEEERKILEETVMPLTPRSSALPSPSRGGLSSTSEPEDTIVRSLADWERKQELLERQSRGSTESAERKMRENDRTSDISTADDSMNTGRSMVSQSSSQAEKLAQSIPKSQTLPTTSAKCSTPDKKQSAPATDSTRPSRSAGERRSVSGRKLCSSCGQPLGKGAAMIIETLSLYFHIHCFKCGVCKGQLGDTTTGTDVRIRNGLLNCNQCYIRSRSAGQPTTL